MSHMRRKLKHAGEETDGPVADPDARFSVSSPAGNYRGGEQTTFYRWDFAVRQVVQGITESSYQPLRNPNLFMVGVQSLTNGEYSMRYTGYTEYNMTELVSRLKRLGASVKGAEGMNGAGGEFEVRFRLTDRVPWNSWWRLLRTAWACAILVAVLYLVTDVDVAKQQWFDTYRAINGGLARIAQAIGCVLFRTPKACSGGGGM